MADEPIRIERVRIENGRLRLDIAFAPGTSHRTTPQLARAAADRFPALPLHTCINNAGPTFSAVMEDTPLPHLLEHLIIDFQTRDARTRADRRFVGTTRWTDEAQGRARIEVNFYDDLIALQAAKDALAALGDMLSGYDSARAASPEGGDAALAQGGEGGR